MPSDSLPTDNIDLVLHLWREKGLDAAALWLTTPRAELGGLTPDQALACGRTDEVARLVFCGAIEARLAS